MPEPDPNDRSLFAVEGLSQELRVARLAGVEGLSELFRVELTFACEDGSLEGDDVIGRPALLTLLGTDGEPRHVHGIVGRFEVGETRRSLTFYRAALVPAVVRLQHRRDCRIFQRMTTPEIVARVLSGAGLGSERDLRLALEGSYAPREYCVQYREPDWSFVSRLLEEEGIPWYFEHHADRHVLVLDDGPARVRPIAGRQALPYRPPSGALGGGPNIARFEVVSEIQPGMVTLRDYNFQKPGLLLEGGARAAADASLEVYDYPGAYDAPARGDQIARIRLEEWQWQRRIGRGESACDELVRATSSRWWTTRASR
jgi:type VI secretion system secreted protein VgrG